MSHYEDLAREFAKLIGASGGTRQQREASAALVYGLIVYHLRELVDALRREGIEARLSERPATVNIACEGCQVEISRRHGQNELRMTLYGFASVLTEHQDQRYVIGRLSVEEAQQHAVAGVRGIDGLFKQEHATQAADYKG